MAAVVGTRLRIGDFRIDTSSDEVSAGGVVTRVEPRTMRLLQYLVARAGEVVSIDELLNQVWADVVVTPDSVYQSIAALRRALGDDPKSPRYIVNVPRRGYRLVAAVAPWEEPVAVPPSVPAATQTTIEVARTTASRWRLAWLGGSALLVVTLALVYWRFDKPTSDATAAVVNQEAPHAKSVAVLAFVDLSEKKDQEYFSDGLSEELINELSHFSDLRVIARTSSFQFKGRNEDMRSIAAKLGVANLLEGSVRTVGNDLRITAQLIRAADGMHLWSQTYDRKRDKIFDTQREIASTVAAAMNVALTTGAQAGEPRPSNIEAYNLMLQGDYIFYRGSKSDNEKAVEYYQRVVTLEPKCALAWAKLAGAYVWRGSEGEISHAEALAKAQDAVGRALSINSNSAKAHYVLGNLNRLLVWDKDAATREYERAIALDPFGDDAASAKQNLAFVEAGKTGQLGNLINVFQQDAIRNPLNAPDFFNLGYFQFLAGNLDQAAIAFRKLFDLNSQFADAQAYYGLVLLAMGKTSEALTAANKEMDEPVKLRALSSIYWAAARRRESDAALQTLRVKFGDVAAFSVAAVYSNRGDLAAAMEWLERANRQRDSYLESIKLDPVLRPLHRDPRFQALLRDMKLPPIASP